MLHSVSLALIVTVMTLNTCECEDARCGARALLKMTALCCGPRLDDREPLLYLSPSNDTPPPASGTCTTLSGLELVPPPASVCCPGPRGRTCCFLPTPWAQPRPAGHWPFNVHAPADVWFYVALAAFLLLLLSTLVLMGYCCQAVVARKQHNKLFPASRPFTRPMYRSITLHTAKIPAERTISRNATLLSQNEVSQYMYGTFR